MGTRLSVVFLVILLAGCAATRDPMPVNITQPADAAMGCEDLQAEYCSNAEIAAAKIAKNNDDDLKDFWLGLLVWPGMADFKNADGIEGNALLDRCIHLRNLAVRKGCDTGTLPALPERYK